VLLGVLVLFLSHIETLEDLGNVAHVEYVVRVRWRGQELFLHVLEELDGADSKRLAEGLNLLLEVVELVGCQ
jgi:hypothetical protein